MEIHLKKCLPHHFQDAVDGNKPYEIRLNDCDYQVGDMVILREYQAFIGAHAEQSHYTGRAHYCGTISHILTSDDFPDGIKDGYAILSFKRL